MKAILEEAKKLEEELIANRRYLHANPELCYALPKTCKFIMDKLKEYGYEPEYIYESCIVAHVGDPTKGKCIMLRADMDALPMKEETDLPFKATGDAAHTCGHDTHMAMLLSAAKILKDHEQELNGCVKLMFQPDEEGYSEIGGCERMIMNGVLENPKVDAVYAIHHWSGMYKAGEVIYRLGGFMSSCDNITISIQGQGTHGSQPQDGVSPINIGCHIYLGLQELIAREVPSYEQTVITLGGFNSGSSFNVMPDTATLTGTLRTIDEDTRTKLKKRITELSTLTAQAYGGECHVEFTAGIPSVYSNPELTKEIVQYGEELLGYRFYEVPYAFSSSDDISQLSQVVPTCYMFLSSGDESEGYCYAHHNPHILFNEDVMYKGTAILANAAIEWLKNH